MLFRSKHVARGGLVALAALALAAPSWAGQVNLSSRTTIISESITSSATSSGSSQSINASGIVASDLGGSSNSVISRSVTISETFVGNTATVSFEVSQEDLNYTSPYNNLFISPSITQSVTASGSGIVNAQTTVGAGNVSIASNGLLDGVSLASITGSLSGSQAAAGAQVATLALTPGFALQNSNANALTQAAAMAIAQGSLGVNATAIDVQQSGVDEYSPHDNVTLAAIGVTQTVNAVGIIGIGAVQTQVGAGNVQAAHTVIMFNPGVDGSAAALFQ